MILLLVGYLLLCWATGFWLTLISRMDWPLEGRVAIGLPVRVVDSRRRRRIMPCSTGAELA